MILAFILTPLGRATALALIILAGIAAIYFYGRDQGADDLQAQINQSNLEAIHEADKARDRTLVDIYNGGLFKNDGYKRD